MSVLVEGSLVAVREEGAAGRAWIAYLAAGSAFAVACYLLPLEGLAQVLAYLLVSASAPVAIWYGVKIHRPRPRLPWLLLLVSQAVYTLADGIFYTSQYVSGSTSFPGPADVFYLLHYPLMVAALVLMIRHRTPGRDLPGLLDASVLAVAAGMVSWLYLIAPRTDPAGPVLLNGALAAYPVADLALLAVGFRLILAGGRRPTSFVLLIGSLLAIFTADTLYVLQHLDGSYQVGNYLDLLWLGGNLTLGAAALHPTMNQLSEPVPWRHRLGPGRIAVLLAAALLGPGLLLLEAARHTPVEIFAPVVASGLIIVLVIARMAGLVADQRRLAITDDLTGLHTRRFIEEQLALEVARAARTGVPVALLIVDVDHFKSINDRHGHPGGDRALIEIARRLQGAIRPGDVLARYGGEEFALLLPGVSLDELPRLADRVRQRVARGPVTVGPDTRVAVTVSVGAASYPEHGTEPDDLIAIADRALYAAKAGGRDRAVIGPCADELPATVTECEEPGGPMVDYLTRIADEVDVRLSRAGHSRTVSRWVEVLATELGHDAATARRAALAGRLRDIGQIVTPEALLAKRWALDAAEWRMLRQHPEQGARLAALVPGCGGVAEIVRQHHEWYDGSGYPARLRGDEIRIEARLVAVCDAWAAMRSRRPYHRALSVSKARDELRRGCGTQFDPGVVDAFLDLQRRGLVGRLEPSPARMVVAPRQHSPADLPPARSRGGAGRAGGGPGRAASGVRLPGAR